MFTLTSTSFILLVATCSGFLLTDYSISKFSPFYKASEHADGFEDLIKIIDDQYCGHPTCGEFPLQRHEPNPLCRKCTCDVTCFQTHNCCPQIAFEYGEYYKESERRMCMSSDISLRENPTAPHYSVIGDCQPSYPDDRMKRLCKTRNDTDPISRIPCLGWGIAVKTDNYRNIFCAMCNDVETVRPWSVEITCNSSANVFLDSSSESELYDAAMVTEDCVFEAWGTRVPVTCYPNDVNLIHICNVSGLWDEEDPLVEKACLLDEYNVPVKNMYYNLFCYICNTNVPWVALLNETNMDVPPERITPRGIIENLPLTTAQRTAEPTSSNICFTGKTFSDGRDRCTYIGCSHGRHFTGAACESHFHTNMLGYEVCAVFQSEISNVSEAGEELDLFSLGMSEMLQAMAGFDTKLLQSYDIETWNCTGIAIHQQHVRFLFFNTDAIRRDWLDIFFFDIFKASKLILPSTCGQSLPIMHAILSPCSLVQVSRTSQNRSYIREAMHLYEFGENVIFVPFSRLIGCCQIILPPEEFTQDTYKTMFIYNTEIYLEYGDYVQLDNGSVMVCLRDFINKPLLICNDPFQPTVQDKESSWFVDETKGIQVWHRNMTSTSNTIQHLNPAVVLLPYILLGYLVGSNHIA